MQITMKRSGKQGFLAMVVLMLAVMFLAACGESITELSFKHVQPGVYSEVYLDTKVNVTGTASTVIATISGPGLMDDANKSAQFSAGQTARVTWKINKVGTYKVTGNVNGTQFTQEITVK